MEHDQRKPIPNDPLWYIFSLSMLTEVGMVFFVLVLLTGFGVSIFSFASGDPTELQEAIKRKETTSFIQQAIHRLDVMKWYLLGAIMIATVLAVIWVQLLKRFTKALVYLSFILGIGSIIAAGLYLIINGKHLQAAGQTDEGTPQFWIGIGVLVFAAVMILVMFLLRKKIALSCALFKEGCKGVQANPALFFVAIILLVVFVAYAMMYILTLIYLNSIPNKQDANGTTKEFFDSHTANWAWFSTAVFIWVGFFLNAVITYVVAGAICYWYFSRSPTAEKLPGSPSFRAFKHALTTSIGTLAFGSLIVTIMQLINNALKRSQRGQRNLVIIFVIAILRCLCMCLQSIIEFLNKFAYIYAAMYGTSFVESGKRVLGLIKRNVVGTILIDAIGGFILFLGHVFGAVVTMLIMVAFLKIQQLPLDWMMIIITGIIALIIFSILGRVVQVSADAVFVAYMEDLERNKESRQTLASIEFHTIVQDYASKNEAYQPLGSSNARRAEFISPEGLRIDGRRAEELRRVRCKMGVLDRADGSAYFALGHTRALATVYGPREVRQRQRLQEDSAIVNCEYSLAAFSMSDRRRNVRKDRRTTEISNMIQKTFESVILLNLFGRSQIDIYVQILQSDGGERSVALNAASLAIIDAGIPVKDFLVACSATFVDGKPMLDPSFFEGTAGGPDLVTGVLPHSSNIVTMQMDVGKLPADSLAPVQQLAVRGARRIHGVVLAQLFEATGERSGDAIEVESNDEMEL